ncbi:uncharacterized protein LOC116308755 [Actinia tenebrosa]|uniref:Uncharacterized protein LOC116308755 n=1 Tax=Actinia tenebrosa TaxID=6105 RepID=A0A6P8J4V9_ACTTE|nr:uncharacterized protein LOC116308755 [Actinia tenebrosa]
MWRKLRSVYTAVTNRGIPAKILLMKIDLVLGDNESIENIHKNKKVRHVKQVIQKELGCGVNEGDMFPIKNYVHHVEFDVDMDILLLDSLLKMLMCAQKYLESK